MSDPQQREQEQDFTVDGRLPKGSGTYFRVAYFTQLDLSRQADHKAHLMLGLNTLVLSLVVSKHHSGVLGKVSYLWMPNTALFIVCLSVAVLAILASRPILPKRPKTQKPNWLFFGSYAAFPFSEFEKNFNRLMTNDTALQEALSRDLFLMGRALAKKYRFLSYCYLTFGIGITIVSLLYVACLFTL